MVRRSGVCLVLKSVCVRSPVRSKASPMNTLTFSSFGVWSIVFSPINCRFSSVSLFEGMNRALSCHITQHYGIRLNLRGYICLRDLGCSLLEIQLQRPPNYGEVLVIDRQSWMYSRRGRRRRLLSNRCTEASQDEDEADKTPTHKSW